MRELSAKLTEGVVLKGQNKLILYVCYTYLMNKNHRGIGKISLIRLSRPKNKPSWYGWNGLDEAKAD